MEQPHKDTAFGKFVRIMGMVMSFIYVVLGVGLFMKAFSIGLEDIPSKILGAALVLYGAYRFYRAMKGNSGT